MKKYLSQPHAIFSLENPLHEAKKPVSTEVGIEALKRLGDGLVMKIRGHYGSPENSIFVANPSEKQISLIRKMVHSSGQESHIESDGQNHKMLYSNGPDAGKIIEGSGTELHDSAPADFYSVMPDGTHFTHNFNFDKNEDQIEGGKGDHNSLEDFDSEEATMGEKVEMEHTDDPELAQEIATDHLTEDKKYYTKLKEADLADELEKSKNVREQKKKIFGTDANAPRLSEKRMKMMQNIRDYTKKKYGLDLNIAQGKRDASGQLRTDKENQPAFDVFSPEGHEKEKTLLADYKKQGVKRVDPKPSWLPKEIQTQPSPDAAIHELAHLELAPTGMDTPKIQEHMDKLWGESQKKHGHMQQKRTAGEIQPMSLENTIRRQLGIPANRATKPVKENEKALDYEGNRFVEGKDAKGNKAFYDRQTRLQTPETKERAQQVVEGSLKFHPEHGWVAATNTDALINLRGRGKQEEATQRLKQKVQTPTSTSGAVDLNSLSEDDHKAVQEFLKQRNNKLAASEQIKKARVDEGKTSEQKRSDRAERKESWERENYGMHSGHSKDPKVARFLHTAKLTQIQDTPKADLPVEKDEKPFKGYNKKKHARTGGLNDKERERINREEGRNLKRPVTGKAKPGSKDAKRRKSFCARMKGVSGPTSKDGKLTPKGAALKRWRC